MNGSDAASLPAAQSAAGAERFTPSASELQHLEALFPLLAKISDPGLRQRTAGVWAYAVRESSWTGAESVPFLRNLADWRLVDHVNAVAESCLAVALALEATLGVSLDLDRLLAASLLHDCAKLVETRMGEDGLEKTELGQSVHHATVGAQWALEAGLHPLIAQAVFCHSPVVNVSAASYEAMLVRDLDTLVTEAQSWASSGRLEALRRPPGPTPQSS